MAASLNAHRNQVLLLGTIGGIWGGVLNGAAGYLQLAPGMAGFSGWQSGIPGAGLGLGLGLFVSPIGNLLDKYPRRALIAAAVGGIGGLVVGYGAMAAGGWLADGGTQAWAGRSAPLSPLALWVYFPLMMALLGAVIGLASTLGGSCRSRFGFRALTGALCGGVGALPLALAANFLDHPWLPLAGLGVWGAVVALGLFWLEKRLAKRWLRLLTAPGEDRIFPLRCNRITLGKRESNTIPLLRFHEVYPYHCKLDWVDGKYRIGDSDQGGMVWVNFREASDHVLASGDLVKIGSALFQYGEAP